MHARALISSSKLQLRVELVASATVSSTAEGSLAAAALGSHTQVEVASSVAVGSLVVAASPAKGTQAVVASFVAAGNPAVAA